MCVFKRRYRKGGGDDVIATNNQFFKRIPTLLNFVCFTLLLNQDRILSLKGSNRVYIVGGSIHLASVYGEGLSPSNLREIVCLVQMLVGKFKRADSSSNRRVF